MNIQALLSEKVSQALIAAGASADCEPQVRQSAKVQFGDYQANGVMAVAKKLGMAPRQLAEQVLSHLDLSGIANKVEIAGPGFINIFLDPAFLAENVSSALKSERLGVAQPQAQTVVVDYSAPNVAKEMHVGHLRSTIIGDALARILEFLGNDVLRINHLGDWGTAFGMLIAYLRETHPGVFSRKESAALADLMRWYKESKALFDCDPEFKKRSQLEVVALQSGNEEALQAWKMICEISCLAYQETYDLLDVKLITRGESFYNPLLPGIVQDLESKGLVTISDGAKCVFLEGFQNREGESLPLMIQKSDGGYNYDTTDMAAIRQRIQEEKADRLIYVTDQGQSTHFHMVFKAAEKAGYLDPSKVRTDHVGFGLVLGADGKKFRTRSGETEKLVDLLNASIEEAKKILVARDPQLSGNELEHAAKVLGLGAVKYADLSSHRMSDYQFSYEKMLRFEGNTAAFILYSYVRVGGIKRKVGIDIETLIGKEPITLTHPSETALALQLCQFQEVLDQVADSLLPNRLTEYLFALAEKFNAFFRDCRVEGAPEQNSRLQMAELTARVLKKGLNLLGIHTLERM